MLLGPRIGLEYSTYNLCLGKPLGYYFLWFYPPNCIAWYTNTVKINFFILFDTIRIFKFFFILLITDKESWVFLLSIKQNHLQLNFCISNTVISVYLIKDIPVIYLISKFIASFSMHIKWNHVSWVKFVHILCRMHIKMNHWYIYHHPCHTLMVYW